MAFNETPTKGTTVFDFLDKAEPTALEAEMKRLLTHLETTPPDEEEYEKVIDQLVKLHKLHESENSHKRVSYDKLADIALSALGILAVINHERIHVITTKALDIVKKTR
jgi:hypothetical protein